MNETPDCSGEARRLRDTVATWVTRNGYRHYVPAEAAEVGVGWAELVHDAEVAQQLLDFAGTQDGHPQSGGDIDTRVAALVLRVTDAEARLAEIADVHARETAAGGMVGDYCVECGHRWPCSTYERTRAPIASPPAHLTEVLDQAGLLAPMPDARTPTQILADAVRAGTDDPILLARVDQMLHRAPPPVTVEEAAEGDPGMEATQAWFRNGGC